MKNAEFQARLRKKWRDEKRKYRARKKAEEAYKKLEAKA